MEFFDIGELRDCFNIDTTFLTNSMEKQLKRASSCAISVVFGGKAYVKAVGRLNLSKDSRNCDTHTKFHISSLSKLFTGYLVEKLVKEGKLKYENTLEEVCPKEIYDKLQLPSKTTVNMLVSHQSGLLNGKISYYSRNYIYSLEEFVADKLPDVDVVNESSGNFYYSDVGMNLVGYICQCVTKEEFASLIRKYILVPLNLKETGFFNDCMDSNICEGVSFENGEMVQLPHIVGNPSFFPSTLMYSSVSDLSIFINHIMDEYDNLQRLFQAQVGFDEHSYYCRTWVYQRYWQKNIFFHHASDSGAFARVYIVPTERCALVFLSNSESIGYAERVTHYFLNKIRINSSADKEIIENTFRKRGNILHFGKEYLSIDGKPKKMIFEREGERLTVIISDGLGDDIFGEADPIDKVIRLEEGHYQTFEIVSAPNGKVDLIHCSGGFYERADDCFQIDNNTRLFMDNLGTYRGWLLNDSEERLVTLESDNNEGMFLNSGDRKMKVLPYPNKNNAFITPLGRMSFCDFEDGKKGFKIRFVLEFRRN